MKVWLIFACAALACSALAEEVGYRQNTGHSFPFEGTVTYSRPGDQYFFMEAADGSGIWRVERERGHVKVPEGTTVRVTGGVANPHSTTRRVNHAHVEIVGRHTGFSNKVRAVTVAELYRHPIFDKSAEDLWGKSVRCEGTVRDVNRRQNFTQLQLGEGQYSFQAAVKIDINTPLPEDLKLGARVAITGIMLYTPVDDSKRHVMTDISNVSVMPLGIEGVEVVSKTPFWTPVKLWVLIGSIAVVLLGVAVWGAMLRRAVMKAVAKLEDTIRAKHKEQIEFDAIRRERLRLSYELHDNFQQLLASAQFRLEAAATWIGNNDEKALVQVTKAQDGLVYTQQQLRTALWGMNEESEGPSSFTGLIRYAIGRMAHWEKVVAYSDVGKEPEGARKYAGAMLMVLQEAIGNALKHGEATKVKVVVSFAENALTMRIVDDGNGFETAKEVGAEHLGLQSMRCRVEELGGRLKVDSVVGKGTTVIAEVRL